MPAATEIVHAALSASAEGIEVMLPYVHEDFVMSTPPDLAAEPQTYNGPEGVRRWFESFLEVMDSVVLELDIVTRGRASGAETAQRAVTLCTVTDDKLIRIQFFGSLDEAREAAVG